MTKIGRHAPPKADFGLRHTSIATAAPSVPLPLATVIFGVIRAGERPKPAFWAFSLLGSALVAAFAFRQGPGGSPVGDALMLAAIVLCGLGYAEGGRLSRRLGGWQVISWALMLSLPLMAALAVV